MSKVANEPFQRRPKFPVTRSIGGNLFSNRFLPWPGARARKSASKISFLRRRFSSARRLESRRRSGKRQPRREKERRPRLHRRPRVARTRSKAGPIEISKGTLASTISSQQSKNQLRSFFPNIQRRFRHQFPFFGSTVNVCVV